MSMARSADALASTQDFEACRQSTLPYGNSVRTLQVDMIAFDSADEVAAAVQLFVFQWLVRPAAGSVFLLFTHGSHRRLFINRLFFKQFSLIRQGNRLRALFLEKRCQF
jgi:hypothetical protein